MLYSNFVGRIGKDGAKVIDGANGQFVTMDVATDYYSKGENRTMWIRVRSSRANHVKLAQYLTKGKMILVQGSQVEDSAWIGKDGEAHSQHVIIADSIEFMRMGKKMGEDGQTQPVAEQSGSNPQAFDKDPMGLPAPADASEDLPF